MGGQGVGPMAVPLPGPTWRFAEQVEDVPWFFDGLMAQASDGRRVDLPFAANGVAVVGGDLLAGGLEGFVRCTVATGECVVLSDAGVALSARGGIVRVLPRGSGTLYHLWLNGQLVEVPKAVARAEIVEPREEGWWIVDDEGQRLVAGRESAETAR